MMKALAWLIGARGALSGAAAAAADAADSCRALRLIMASTPYHRFGIRYYHTSYLYPFSSSIFSTTMVLMTPTAVSFEKSRSLGSFDRLVVSLPLTYYSRISGRKSVPAISKDVVVLVRRSTVYP